MAVSAVVARLLPPLSSAEGLICSPCRLERMQLSALESKRAIRNSGGQNPFRRSQITAAQRANGLLSPRDVLQAPPESASAGTGCIPRLLTSASTRGSPSSRRSLDWMSRVPHRQEPKSQHRVRSHRGSQHIMNSIRDEDRAIRARDRAQSPSRSRGRARRRAASSPRRPQTVTSQSRRFEQRSSRQPRAPPRTRTGTVAQARE